MLHWHRLRPLQRLEPMAHRYWKFSGGTKPPNSCSSSAANVIVVWSSSHGPTSCTPTGRPDAEISIGAAVAGRPATVATPDQTI